MSSAQLDSLQALVEQPRGAVGSELSDLIARLKTWAADLNLDGLARAALHALYHYVVDVAWPKLKTQTPDYLDTLVDSFLLPVLTKIHDALFGADK